MGKKRRIKESVRQKYGQEIARSEQMAQAGYNPNKPPGPARINEDIYGPTTMGAVDPLAEMKALEDAGLADDSIRTRRFVT